APPKISMDDQIVANPPQGQTAIMTFHVTLDAPSTQVVTVMYSTQNQTAVAGTDYTQKSGTLTFQPGTTTMNIDVTILRGPGTTNKQFVMNLANPTNATIAVVNGF